MQRQFSGRPQTTLNLGRGVAVDVDLPVQGRQRGEVVFVAPIRVAFTQGKRSPP